MAVALNKFEKTLVFGGFIAVAGTLVGGAYVVSTFLPSAENPAVVADSTKDAASTDIDELIARVHAPSTQPASTLTLVAVPTAAALPTVATSPMDWQTIEILSPATRPATQPAMAVAISVPATQPVAVAIAAPTTRPVAVAIAPPATKPVEVKPAVVAHAPPPALIKPYAIDLAASRVTHMYCSEAGTQPTWYEMKLDAEQMTVLAAAASAIATANHHDAEEYDHLAVMWPNPDFTLPWWRPSELIDPDLLLIAGPSGADLWIAMSRRTGRTFFYTSKPVDFTAAR